MPQEPPAGGHAGRGQSSSETGGANEPTAQKPPNEGKGVADVGEFRGSEFQSNRAAAHKVSE